MYKKLLYYLVILFLSAGLIEMASAQIIVEDAATTWEGNLESAQFPAIPTRIVSEYITTIYDTELVYSEDLINKISSLPARIVVEYATDIAQFGLEEPDDNEPPPSLEYPVIDSFTADPSSGNPPLSVTFTCEAHDLDGFITDYQFNFGDGENDSSPDGLIIHDYTNRGVYRATCTAVDNEGLTKASNPTVILVDAPEGDHFLSYKVKISRGTPRFERQYIALVDQFENKDFQVNSLLNHFNPADKNNEGINDLDTHLVRYLIKQVRKSCLDSAPLNPLRACEKEENCGGTTGETKYCKKTPKFVKQTLIRVDNQLGTLFVDTIRPDSLLVPTAKDTLNPVEQLQPVDIDHFKCYRIKITKGTDKFLRKRVTLSDQFIAAQTLNPKLYDVIRPTMLCAPAKKNNEPLVDPQGLEGTHLMCYKVRQARRVCAPDSPENPLIPCNREEICGGKTRQTSYCISQPRHEKLKYIYINNQFGSLQIDSIREDGLCIPSVKTIIRPQ